MSTNFDGRDGHVDSGASASGGPDIDQFELRDVFNLLNRRRFIFLSTVTALTGLAAAATYLLPPQYSATAEIMIDPSPTSNVNAVGAIENQPKDYELIDSEIQYMRSQKLIGRVIDNLDLTSNPIFLEDDEYLPLHSVLSKLWRSTTSSASELSKSLSGDSPGTPTGAFGELKQVNSPAPDSFDQDIARILAIERLNEDLEIERSDDSFVVQITYDSASADLAASVPLQFIKVYTEDQAQKNTGSLSTAIDWLQQRIDSLKAELLSAEAEIETYRTDHNLLGVENGGASSVMVLLETTIFDEEAKLVALEARLRQIEALNESGSDLLTVSELNTPQIVNLLEQRNELEQERGQAAKDFGPNHPIMLQFETEQAILEQRTSQAIDDVISSVKNEIVITQGRIGLLNSRYDEAKASNAQRNRDDIRARLLEKETESLRTTYTTALDRLQQLQEQQNALEKDYVQIISVPRTPEIPSFPNPPLMIAGGFTCSLVLGTLFAFVRDRWDKTLHSSKDVETMLGIPCWAVLPRLPALLKKKQNRYTYLAANTQSNYFESLRGLYFNTIRDPSHRLGMDERRNFGKIVMVTSATPNEGKSTLALSFAMAAASLNAKTILLDFDLHNPSIETLIGNAPKGKNKKLPEPSGTSRTRVSAYDDLAVYRLQIVNLHFGIPQIRDDTSFGFLSSESTVELINQDFRDSYDLIVIDMPPVIGLADVGMLAPYAEFALFAVHWGETERDVARHGVDIIQNRTDATVGAILTQANFNNRHFYSKEDAAPYSSAYKKYYHPMK